MSEIDPLYIREWFSDGWDEFGHRALGNFVTVTEKMTLDECLELLKPTLPHVTRIRINEKLFSPAPWVQRELSPWTSFWFRPNMEIVLAFSNLCDAVECRLRMS